MIVLSLFDGMSVAQQALEELNIPINKYYASEIDSYATAVTKYNFPCTVRLGNIKYITKNKIPDEKSWLSHNIDLLIGGSPCQDLSIGKTNRKGLVGEKSCLFWEYVRILNEIKPKYFVLENVKSMAEDQKNIISETLGVNPIAINASLVSKQNRDRLFWTNIQGITQPQNKQLYGEYYVWRRTYWRKLMRNKCPTLLTSMGGGGGNIPFINSNGIFRKLNCIELESLQGLPVNYTQWGININNKKILVPNKERYKMIGNAFNCEVVKHILSFI